MARKFSNFGEFYPYYLAEHSNRTCRRLHFVGTTLILFVIGWAVWARQPLWLLLVPVVGYGFAWVGHFFFEKNRPATFTYPLYSLMGDWVMWKDVLVGKVRI
ncbi:DUF962 domain-containing protein [Elongatibacter sediminis]|uniref:DUF962 domain-containing protein n=1 Tax=Elongatibacter sediminis TaxID=3119006 RepID=A0AAW9RAH3_9GAMM